MTEDVAPEREQGGSRRERHLVLGASYALLTLVILLGVFHLKSDAVVLTCVSLAVGLAALLYADFSFLKIGFGGVEAERDRKARVVTASL